MQTLVALVVCMKFAAAGAFPGPSLRGLPNVQWPSQVRHLPVQAPAFPKRLSLQDALRNAVVCCRDMTAECMACATNQDLSDFCIEHARVPGCESLIENVKEKSQTLAFDRVVNTAVETAAERVGGVKAEALVDKYLEEHPTVARTNLANITSKAFDAISKIKKSLMHRSDDDVGVEPGTSQAAPVVLRDGSDERASETTLDVDDDFQETAADESPTDILSFKNPWVIAVSALVVTSITTGIAVGALCHARIQTHAREPLLSMLLQDIDARTASSSGN